MRKIERVLLHHKSKKLFLVKDLADNFHTPFGTLSKADLQSSKEKIKSDKGELFTVLQPSFSDLYHQLQRGPQVMIQKDIGLILAKTGVNQESRVVDAGGGSGSLCLSLANVCKEISVYEINPEHYDIVQKNINMMGFTNITLKQENVYKGISETDIDLVTFDLPEPWLALEHGEKALKTGGWLVVYLPNLLQVKEFIEATKKTKIYVLETLELIERKWKIEDRIMRPEFEMLGHTGFLTFARKL
ncbi:methyltransferase domain-containing protein [Candidatus Woesearchaeota archaeon]|nr:methyltransferase domain-containing protein [Candidatus Woesearchaeota archaeon]